MSEPAQLLLVRHGQSSWNAEGRWQGDDDPPLSTLGVRQARHAAQHLGGFDAVVASDLQRAIVTATIIADELGIGPVHTEPALRERCAGEFQGLTRPEIEERFPGYLAARRRPPGWEPDEHLLARARRALHRIAEAVPGGDVLVVTHGGLVYTVEEHLGADHARLANAEGRWLAVVAGGPMHLGDRVLLSEPEDTTVPDQI